MDCSRTGWTVDYLPAHLPPKGRKLGDFETVLAEMQAFMRGRLGQHLILGGDFNASFYGLTDFHLVGESIPRPRTLTDTNDTLRARALHAVVGRAGLDDDEHLDGRRLRTGAVHTMQLDGNWRRADANGFYHGIEETGSKTSASIGLRLVQDGSLCGACCSFVEIETETFCETWSEFTRLETKRFMAKSGLRDVDRLEKLDVMAPLLLEAAQAHNPMETKETTWTETSKLFCCRRSEKDGTSGEQSSTDFAPHQGENGER